MKDQLVYGVHPVQELLHLRPQEVDRIFVARDARAGIGQVLREARQLGIPVKHVPREVLRKMIGARAVHQGIAAQVAPLAYSDLEDLCAESAKRSDSILVLVDRVTDPRNLGSIIRTCAAAGCAGLLLAGEQTVGLTPVVIKASAGLAGKIPIARESRPTRRIEALRDLGFRSVALDPRGETAWNALDLAGRLLVVVGGEARGARGGLARACDERARIPLAPGVDSLNVAISTGVLLFEAVRQRGRSSG